MFTPIVDDGFVMDCMVLNVGEQQKILYNSIMMAIPRRDHPIFLTCHSR